ncbi:tetratricopeptide repeat protein [Saccharicrinis aurantiacus]|uniref:tetratricopeptide repeat protein n=1 Tax=Saccharicrinis aurantiacus TaxID=1849719 RepID=UPI002492E6E9|nr:tetratricopeptide repeat protein [Saccharicrinis aurantiacus]
MQKTFSKYHHTFLLCLIIGSFIGLNAQNNIDLNKKYFRALSLQYTQQDSALVLLKQCKEAYSNLRDTSKVIDCLTNMSSIYTSNANYTKSYDALWEALILTKKTNNSGAEGKIYDSLGMLYALFQRNDEALRYFHKAVIIKKQQLESESAQSSLLNSTYYALAIYHRERSQFKLAQAYLDSCNMVLNKIKAYSGNRRFINAEQAYLFYHSGKLKVAEELLLSIEPEFKERNDSYNVILYSFLGDIYDAKNNFKLSEKYYLKSIKTANIYKSHLNFLPEAYKKLAHLYSKNNIHIRAFNNLEKGCTLNDSLFGARSVNNSKLLQIKDDYRIEQEKQKELLKEAQLTNARYEKDRWFFRNILLTVILIATLIIAAIMFFYLRNRNQLLKQDQLLKEEKNKEILEIKNKELTASALQLIEKDELLISIKEQLNNLNEQNKGKSTSTKRIISQIKTNSKQDWDTFNARFTDVNQSFYDALSQQFPELTQRDHKLCALIKLSFSSKDMALLLGISVESVHTSRYRLRQKLSLQKGDNLGEFIARIG